MKKLLIRGTEYRISFTVSAYVEVCNLCGSIENLREWLSEGKAHDKLKSLLTLMIRAYEREKNYKIRKGFIDGEVAFDEVNLPKYFNSTEIIIIYNAVFSEITQALYHEIPKNVDIKRDSEDFGYEFIMQRKAEEKGVKRPNKALSAISRGLMCGLDYETIMNTMTPGEVMQIWLYQLESKGGTNGKA